MFITVEGIDGSGKTTLIKIVEKILNQRDVKPIVTREPTDLPTGKIIRTFLKQSGSSDLYHQKLALAFASDRLNHLNTTIIPNIKSGKTVISDRYLFSSLAYQSVNLDYEWIKSINFFARLPELVIYIDLPVSVALSRITSRGEDLEIFESESFLSKIKKNYNTILDDYDKKCNIIKIDGNKPISELESVLTIELNRFFLTPRT